MYSNRLVLGLLDEDICTDEYEYSDEGSQKCNFCEEKYNKSYLTYLYDLQIKTRACFLCNSVVNFNGLTLGKCFLICSDVDQNEINSQTLKMFKKNTVIPKISEIDENAKIVNMSIFLFIKCFSLMDKKEKKMFDNIKICFTEETSSCLTQQTQNFQNYFNDIKKSSDTESSVTKQKKEKYDISYLDLESYEFTKNQQKILDNKIILINNSNNLEEIRKNLSDLENDSIKRVELLNSLNIK